MIMALIFKKIAKIVSTKVVIVSFILLTSSCTTPSPEYVKVSLPKLPSNVTTLKVAYAINPRFNVMSENQLKLLLQETQRTVKEHFKIDVKFTPIKRISIDQLFNVVSPEFIQQQQEGIFNFKDGTGDKPRVVRAMKKALMSNRSSLAEMIEYAQPLLLYPLKEKTYDGLAESLVETMLGRIKQWKKLSAIDNSPVIDDSQFNEWVIWDVLGYGNLPYDIVLTNQLIASVDYYGQAVHSAIRGGITAGTTTYSKNSPFGSYIFWSTFLYDNKYDLITELRGGESYSHEEGAQLSGAYLAHEIGHQLFQFGHPYEEKSCVMHPVELLKFRQWYEQLDANQCKIGSNEQMELGKLPVYFNKNW